MTFAAALYIHLTTDATLTAYCDTRIYPVVAPDDRQSESASFPELVIYQQVGREPDANIPQASNYRVERWAVTAVSADYDDARSMADAIVTRLDYYKGTMGQSGSPLSGGVKVKSISLEEQSDSFDFESAAYAVANVFRVAYEPA